MRLAPLFILADKPVHYDHPICSQDRALILQNDRIVKQDRALVLKDDRVITQDHALVL